MKILVITVNALHLGYLGCYGNDWIDTPSLDRLASQGVVFDQHYADRPNGVGARQSWRTGCYRFPTPEEPEGRPGSNSADLLSIIHESGIATALIRNSRSPADFAAGWDTVATISEGNGDTPLERILETVRETLDHLASSKQWLLWVELADLFPPWEPAEDLLEFYFQDEPEADAEDEGEETGEEEISPETLLPLLLPESVLLKDSDDAIWKRLQRTYAAAVTQMDSGVGQILEDLDNAGLSHEMVVVFTADRGIALGEHGLVGETLPWLHDELIHLPLIVRLPGEAEAGRRIAALTQPVDLLPTFLNFFGLTAVPGHGQSILPLTTGKAEQVRAYACAGLAVGGAIEWVLRTLDCSFILPIKPAPGQPPRPAQLYVKPDDRWEVNNVLQHHLELAEQLEKTLREFVLAACRPGFFIAPPLPKFIPGSTEPET